MLVDMPGSSSWPFAAAVLGLDSGESARNPMPAIRDSEFGQPVIGKPILGLPHMAGNIVRELVHGYAACHCAK